MKVYHRTTATAAQSILTNGFRDGHGTYMTDREFSGVWVSPTPLDPQDSIVDTVLALDIPDEVFVEYEWVDEVFTFYREALIPAALLNDFDPPVVVIIDDSELLPLPSEPEP